ncbi:AP2-like ethylene-responsive transcription factor AIL5 [Hondaea fermentalgiana]|uniref:AP2-like ethylene-responsive transcription factor AIL5 n=1 Tax=Hondaea fermentalgiana TaxID=2315210 RepID=A0A2R5H2I8_9STRA|nr:AP2-like ethylene-responsive transcription factor AIL5 [Hondaea fermentalgiana]|eukprot:GBG34604.1 AP2-like ethylene-responsive transcription factor AIL5 [Hondaea fermentalgiana]
MPGPGAAMQSEFNASPPERSYAGGQPLALGRAMSAPFPLAAGPRPTAFGPARQPLKLEQTPNLSSYRGDLAIQNERNDLPHLHVLSGTGASMMPPHADAQMHRRSEISMQAQKRKATSGLSHEADKRQHHGAPPSGAAAAEKPAPKIKTEASSSSRGRESGLSSARSVSSSQGPAVLPRSNSLPPPSAATGGSAAAAHREQEKSVSKYRGVSWHKRDRRWLARLWVAGKIRYLGSFCDEDEAALAVDLCALKEFGEHCPRLNFTSEQREQVKKTAQKLQFQ